MFRSHEHPMTIETISSPATVALRSLIFVLVTGSTLAGRFTSQATGFAGSPWLHGPHRAENFPPAVRELLEHRQHSATRVLRLATRRVDIRSSVSTPLDGPATFQKSEVLGFRD